MKRYDIEYYSAIEIFNGEWVKYTDVEKILNLCEKLKDWHSKALKMQAKMAEDIEPYLNKIDELEVENKLLTVNRDDYKKMYINSQQQVKKHSDNSARMANELHNTETENKKLRAFIIDIVAEMEPYHHAKYEDKGLYIRGMELIKDGE